MHLGEKMVREGKDFHSAPSEQLSMIFTRPTDCIILQNMFKIHCGSGDFEQISVQCKKRWKELPNRGKSPPSIVDRPTGCTVLGW